MHKTNRMKRNEIYLRLCFLFMALTSVLPMFSQGYRTNFMLSPAHFCDTIPLEFEDNQLYIPITMQGHRLRINLDTGSSQGMIFQGSRLNWNRDLGNVVSRDANDHLDTMKVVTLPSFQLGHLTITDYVAAIMPKPIAKSHYDAIIGFDLFQKGICAKIDTQKKILILTDNRHAFDNEPGYDLRYKLKWFVPYVLVSPFIRHVDEVLFDTGSRPLYTMNKQSFDRHAYKSKNVESQVEGRTRGQLAIGVHGIELQDEVAFLHLDRLKWDRFALTNIHSVTTQGSSRIGAQLLNYGTITINPFRRTLTFRPFADNDSVEVGNKPFRIAFVPNKGRACVGLIFEQSDVYKAGMRQGDIVLSINSKPINSFEEFLHYPFVDGQVYTFTVRTKEGQLKEVVSKR